MLVCFRTLIHMLRTFFIQKLSAQRAAFTSSQLHFLTHPLFLLFHLRFIYPVFTNFVLHMIICRRPDVFRILGLKKGRQFLNEESHRARISVSVSVSNLRQW